MECGEERSVLGVDESERIRQSLALAETVLFLLVFIRDGYFRYGVQE